MVYSQKKDRGIVDKQFCTRKFFSHKHALYMISFCSEFINGGLMMLVITLRMGVVLQSQVERTSLLRMQVGMNNTSVYTGHLS